MVLFGTVMVCIYPVGIPLLYFMLTFSKRHILLKPTTERTDEEQAAVAHIGFLVANYKPDFWFFEVIECVRKLLLTSALIFISPGSATQGVFGLLMSMASQRLYIGCKQFPDPSDNRLGELAQWQLVFTFLAALMIKVDVTSNISSYDKIIFEYLLLAILFFAPTINFFDPVMKYICGKKVQLAEVNMGTFGVEAPSVPVPKDLKKAIKVAKQAKAASKKANKKADEKAPQPGDGTWLTAHEVVAEPIEVQGGPPAEEAVATTESVILTGAGEQSTEKHAKVGNGSMPRQMTPLTMRKHKVSARLC